MKQMNKTKKIKTSVVLKTIVVLIALFAILLNSIMGITKAEYFKKLSKSLDFEAMPDLPLEYYLYHAGDYYLTTFRPESGIYYNSDSFMQYITPGKANTVNYTTNSSGATTGPGTTSGPSGANVVYQIKIPVDETGYYTLDFLTYIILGNTSTYVNYLSHDYYTLSYRYCVGCEVLTSTDDFEFGVNKPLSMANRIFAGDALATANSTSEKLLYSDSTIAKDSAIPKDSVYQWKTMCPYRAENVSLTFKAEQADVDKGYVIWGWDFSGLEGGYNYTLFVENLSVNKRMELDGTTKYRDNNTPYFMFPQTAYANNIKVEGTTTNNDSTGMGRSRYSAGRGTYVTEATDNSLGMRAELLYGNDKGKDNPLSLYIPLKNVQQGATYKVTFDFSVARQGIACPDSTKKNGWNGDKDLTTEPNPDKFQKDWHSYNSGFANIFNEEAWNSTDSRMFQSYLVSGATTQTEQVVKTSRNGHRDAQDLITYNNKHYSSYDATSNGNQYTYGYPLTKYDEVIKYNKNYASSLTAFPDYTTSTNINDTYSIGAKQGTEDTYTSTSMRNFFNAVQHTEYNGQYEIHWITFYNTTFSFNIANDVDLDDLYWVWAIDALRYTAFYNLRIENVRIERVVDFASELDANGVKIGDNQIDTTYMDNYGVGTGDEDKGPFNNYRGWNSTGQNYQARGHATTTYLPKGNIYAPIIDASKFTFSKDSDYIIALDGKAVLKGGVDRYVYSIDGGRTWADMEFSGGEASADQLKAAEAGIDMYVQGQTDTLEKNPTTTQGHDMIEFNSDDASNASFDDFALSVDLVEYKHQANLDIIIAAVSNDCTDYRCEILRIVNFNQVRNYVSFPYDFVSNITVTNTVHNNSGAITPLNAFRINDTNETYKYSQSQAEGVGFSVVRAWNLGTNAPNSTTAYARMATYSHAYKDVRAAWTGFAVKKTLGITGWAIVEGGIDDSTPYFWSADNGKTWNKCDGNPADTAVGKMTKIKQGTYHEEAENYKTYYYDGSSTMESGMNENYIFCDSRDGHFTDTNFKDTKNSKDGSMLTADLSGHVGEVLDVIFAAKPNNSDVYVPVGRVDNVAVYGDPKLPVGTAGRGMGTFCSKMNEVRLDDQEYKNGIMITLRYKEGDPSFARTNWGDIRIGIDTASLSYLEPYHVNLLNARFYNETVQEVKSGGKIEIEGFTVVEGGVKRYKYSLDGGETWTIINTKQQGNYENMWEHADDPEYKFRTQAWNSANGSGINLLDGNNGNNVSYTHEDNAWLVVNLPALPAGVEKNLLVVAESNIPDNSGNADSGFIYPVLQMKIRIKN